MVKLTMEQVVARAVVFTGDEVTAAWRQSPLAHLELISTNKKYRALPRDIWDAILATHLTAVKSRYEENYFDCDAYAAAFMGLVAWRYDINGVARVLDNSAHHSYNAILLVSDDSKTCSWLMVEPQSDGIVGDPSGPVVHTKAGDIYTATAGFAVTA